MVNTWEELYKKYGIKQKNRLSNRFLIIAAFVLILGILSLLILQQNKSGTIASSQENPNAGNINGNHLLEGGASIKPKCMSDADCNDNNISTSDICENPGLPSSYCLNNLKTCSELEKNICGVNETCSGFWVSSSDSTRCCSASCTKLQCSDDTSYGQCSSTKPKYCNNGILTDKCSVCGCNVGHTCKTDGSCADARFDFSLSAYPAAGTAVQGSNASTTITLTLLSGNAPAAILSCSNLPAGASCSFSSLSINSTSSSTLIIATSASTPAGAYQISVLGTGSNNTKNTSYTLTVNVPAFDFSLALNSASGSVSQGSNTTTTVTAALLSGIAQQVGLYCSGLPSGASCSFNPSFVTTSASGASSVLTVSTTSAVPAGTYSVNVIGMGSITRTKTFSLSVSEIWSDNSPYNIKVLDLSYIPTVNGKVDTSLTGDWQNSDINALATNINNLRSGLIDTLQKGSIYHGYKDSSAFPSLSYDVIEKKIFYNAVPISTTFKGMDGVTPSADHMKILNDMNICDYVENRGVKEVWIWMYHTTAVAPIESNMAGPYGDISNSYRLDDLPVCKSTYTVYDYNYGRSYSMAVEDHGHQIEAILKEVDYYLFWNLFVGPNGGGRCGWAHYPPNGRYDYDWNNENSVMSDCKDWKPDGSGQKESTSCRTWSTNPSACDVDEGLSWKKWWMQNIPGKNNSLIYNGKKLKNWWVFIGDFDNSMKSRSLTY